MHTYPGNRYQKEKQWVQKDRSQAGKDKKYVPPLNNSCMRIHNSRNMLINKRDKSSCPTFSIINIVELQKGKVKQLHQHDIISSSNEAYIVL